MTEDVKIDPTTNMPVLPTDHRWNVVKTDWRSHYMVKLERYVTETRSEPVPRGRLARFLDRPNRYEERTVSEWQTVESMILMRPLLDEAGEPKRNMYDEPMYHYEKVLTPELVLEFATALYEKWTAEQAENARVEAGESLLGEYPPKSL